MKGDKSFEMITMKAMGREIYSESGFDGEQEWEYKKAMKKAERERKRQAKKRRNAKHGE